MSDNKFVSYFIEGMFMHLSKDIIWYEYKEKDNVENCKVCNLVLLNGDRCYISDCEHNFHQDCIARYSNRVENCCPICKTEFKPKFTPFQEIDREKLKELFG